MNNDGPGNAASTDANRANQHDQNAAQLKNVPADRLSTGDRERLGAAIRGQEEKANAAQAAANTQAERARIIKEQAEQNKQAAERANAVKQQEENRHVMEKKSEEARAGFNEAAKQKSEQAQADRLKAIKERTEKNRQQTSSSQRTGRGLSHRR